MPLSTVTPPHRIVFIDVDGTLVDHDGVMAPSSATAIARARANGHLVYLCTGRSAADLVENVQALEVDGAITNGGATTMIGDEIVHTIVIPRGQLLELTSWLDQRDDLVFLQARLGVYADDRTTAQFAAFARSIGREANDMFRFANTAEADLDEISKVVYFSASADSLDDVKTTFGDTFDIVGASIDLHSGSGGEITPKGTNKGSAILAELGRLGIDPADAVGIGDSFNDVDMFRVVGTSIAMGNAVPEVKAIATATTTSVLDDGVEHALRLAGLL